MISCISCYIIIINFVLDMVQMVIHNCNAQQFLIFYCVPGTVDMTKLCMASRFNYNNLNCSNYIHTYDHCFQ